MDPGLCRDDIECSEAPVTLFALYRSADDPTALPVAVAERFSWFAALLPPVHALAHRLWGQLGLYALGIGAIALGAPFVGFDATVSLYILLALACGFAAPGAERRTLARRGFRPLGHQLAGNADLARVTAFEVRS